MPNLKALNITISEHGWPILGVRAMWLPSLNIDLTRLEEIKVQVKLRTQTRPFNSPSALLAKLESNVGKLSGTVGFAGVVRATQGPAR